MILVGDRVSTRTLEKGTITAIHEYEAWVFMDVGYYSKTFPVEDLVKLVPKSKLTKKKLTKAWKAVQARQPLEPHTGPRDSKFFKSLCEELGLK